MTTVESYGWNRGEIHNIRSSITETTWKGYCLALAQFADLYRLIFPEGRCASFEEFGARCTTVISRLMDGKNITFASLTKLRSALSLISESAFNKGMSEYAPLCRLVSTARRTKRSRQINYNIWNPSMVFDYYLKRPDNTELSFKELTIKCILLVVLTSACRFAELASIDMEKTEWINEGVSLSVKLKTHKERTSLLITKIPADKALICPVRCIETLWEIASTVYHEKTFLLNTRTHTPLTAPGIRKLARAGMDAVGIPRRFTPYSLKHAGITDLLRKGVPEALVSRHARLSEMAHTAVQHYFRVEFEAGISRILSEARQERKP